MLRALIFIMFSIGCIENLESKPASCRACSSSELARKDDSYQTLNDPSNILKMHDFDERGSCQIAVENLQIESAQKAENLKNTKEFQEVVIELQNNGETLMGQASSLKSTPSLEHNLHETNLTNATLHIFVSFSLGEKALLNLAQEAKQFGATLVLRGFREGSYRKTVQALNKIITKTGQGVIIDPELFSLFNITAVPTFVLTKPFQLHFQIRAQTPIHDKLQGYVSTHYALEVFAKEGDLKEEARLLLDRRTTP